MLCIGCLGMYILPLASAGSYPFAEEYHFKCKEDALINVIDSFKRLHKEYAVPDKLGFEDGRRDSTDYWHHYYFYMPDENKVIKSWVRANLDGSTDLAFVSVLYGNSNYNWKHINNDLSWSDNKKELKQFNEKIVVPIRKLLNEPHD
jgi:hypothetical protein